MHSRQKGTIHETRVLQASRIEVEPAVRSTWNLAIRRTGGGRMLFPGWKGLRVTVADWQTHRGSNPYGRFAPDDGWRCSANDHSTAVMRSGCSAQRLTVSTTKRTARCHFSIAAHQHQAANRLQKQENYRVESEVVPRFDLSPCTDPTQ